MATHFGKAFEFPVYGVESALLLDDAHHTELAQRVNYAALTGTAPTADTADTAGELPGQLDLLTDGGAIDSGVAS